jgi:hypothetical protein
MTPPTNAEMRLGDVGKEAAARRTGAAKGEGQDQREQQDADRVVPVEQLEPPLLGRELLRIGPRSPAEHRDDAHHHRRRV